jgi:hypothetical protein
VMKGRVANAVAAPSRVPRSRSGKRRRINCTTYRTRISRAVTSGARSRDQRGGTVRTILPVSSSPTTALRGGLRGLADIRSARPTCTS